jgi:adenine-specific DNA methylase
MEEGTAAETAAPSWKPVAELAKTALESSTVTKGDSQGDGRPRLECLFCGTVYVC